MVLYVASDLLWATRIRRTLDDLGIPARPVRNRDMLRDRLADSPVRALIVDLEAADAIELISMAREGTAQAAVGNPDSHTGQRPRIHITAFGPHVATDRLEGALAAGADEALARGAFDRRLGEILGRFR